MRTRTLSFLLLLAALPAAGADVSFGFQVHAGLPVGTFGDDAHLDRKAGFGLGFQVPVDFGAGHFLKPRLDYLAFRRGDGALEYRTDTLLLRADYNYFFEEEHQGTYFIAGLGVHSTRRKAERFFNAVTAKADDGTTGLAYDLGLGYAFTPNAALEVTWLGMNMGPLPFKNLSARDAGFMGNTVLATFSYRF